MFVDTNSGFQTTTEDHRLLRERNYRSAKVALTAFQIFSNILRGGHPLPEICCFWVSKCFHNVFCRNRTRYLLGLLLLGQLNKINWFKVLGPLHLIWAAFFPIHFFLISGKYLCNTLGLKHRIHLIGQFVSADIVNTSTLSDILSLISRFCLGFFFNLQQIAIISPQTKHLAPTTLLRHTIRNTLVARGVFNYLSI